MSDTWIKETMEIIEELRVQREKLDDRMGELLQQLNYIDGQIISFQELLQLYRERHNISIVSEDEIKPGRFKDRTYAEILIDLAKQSGGYLKVANAVEVMLIAGVNTDRRVIQSNVYGTLGRMKSKFKQIRKGEYQLVNGKVSHRGLDILDDDGNQKKLGLKEAVKLLKESQPSATAKMIKDFLIEQGFDFQGKRASSAVNMAYASLGYGKKRVDEKQEALPLEE